MNEMKHWEVEYIITDTTWVDAETEQEAIEEVEERGYTVTGAKEIESYRT